MAKADPQVAQVIEPVNSIDEFPLSVDEFCTSLSLTDRRVELIGAFNSIEKQAGNLKDTRTAYAARYQAFINAPA
jgi:hypothetical protein